MFRFRGSGFIDLLRKKAFFMNFLKNVTCSLVAFKPSIGWNLHFMFQTIGSNFHIDFLQGSFIDRITLTPTIKLTACRTISVYVGMGLFLFLFLVIIIIISHGLTLIIP